MISYNSKINYYFTFLNTKNINPVSFIVKNQDIILNGTSLGVIGQWALIDDPA